MEKRMNKKWFLIPLAVMLIVMVLVVVWYVSSTQWTRDFDLRYVDYVSESERGNLSGSSYYLYEITNNTNRTLKDVSVVILVDGIVEDFEYEDSVSYRIKPGETVEYRLYAKDYEKVAEERGIELGFLSVSSVDIVKIKYSK